MGRPKKVALAADPANPGTVIGVPVIDSERQNTLATEQHDQLPSAPVRVLVNCALGACNTVITLTQSEIREAVAAGLVDPDPAAVAAAT